MYDNDCDKKMLDVNNAVYVDSFSYLTSKLLNEYGFVHGLITMGLWSQK